MLDPGWGNVEEAELPILGLTDLLTVVVVAAAAADADADAAGDDDVATAELVVVAAVRIFCRTLVASFDISAAVDELG